MEVNKKQSRSHLYLLRLWREDETDLPGEWSRWNARIQHVFSGETQTLQACPQIVEVLLKLSGGEERGQSE
jgi:hypothetical protein